MKANTATNHVTGAPKRIAKIVQTPKSATSPKETGEHLVGRRRNAALIAAGSVVAAACGYIALRIVAVRKGSAQKHNDWKVTDAKLDVSLEQAANTSEPTAVY
jgi:hypothetical protein